jgi:hypothetical protein
MRKPYQFGFNESNALVQVFMSMLNAICEYLKIFIFTDNLFFLKWGCNWGVIGGFSFVLGHVWLCYNSYNSVT